ncbi:cysteine--tRNA ligase [Lujinxingia litoralis]|uniref:Cysteine--tRNA ligase n=1 Tax=Lujinxingia litoralis TaxID=2211119 RepID=A0A328C512_9DELT|nr:cysteine--tRNA ligase [Lujinxingia litoralis]RAL21829.1 cysteine--tRNA ligase [Lujinxingia litoralis]
MSIRPITLFDTMSDQKRPFEPAEPGKVSMYVCGVTVYDLTHIGHARVYIFFDVVQRYLRHLGYEVTYVRNHTDVDDKIIKRAAEKGIDPLELSRHFIEAFDEDMGQLGVAPADVEPKVSEHIDAIIAMVERLIERGHAYAVEGDVYFRISSFDDYGKLSGRKLDDMEAGRSGRVEASDIKEHPFDFALWKGAKADELGWESPWGFGRPGWHIECSAMSQRYLGDSFDIHGGGRDLIFPHHENEIAQSEAACGHAPFANYWMHIGMVNVAETNEAGDRIERKMSKSLGNFWTTREVMQGIHPEAIRYFMHTVLYRNPITYAVEQLEEATSRVEYLYTCLTRIDEALSRAGFDAADHVPPTTDLVAARQELITTFMERFEEALADDFNTPRALALVGELARAINDATQSKKKPKGEEPYTLLKLRELLLAAGAILGLLQREPQTALRELRDLKVKALDLDADHIESLITQRKEARDAKDWARADALRDELDALQVEIMDGTEGTSWRIK